MCVRRAEPGHGKRKRTWYQGCARHRPSALSTPHLAAMRALPGCHLPAQLRRGMRITAIDHKGPNVVWWGMGISAPPVKPFDMPHLDVPAALRRTHTFEW